MSIIIIHKELHVWVKLTRKAKTKNISLRPLQHNDL